MQQLHSRLLVTNDKCKQLKTPETYAAIQIPKDQTSKIKVTTRYFGKQTEPTFEKIKGILVLFVCHENRITI